MRILIIHTRYRQKGGEDTAVSLQYGLIKKDLVCEKLIYHNDRSILSSIQFIFSIWNISASTRLKKVIKAFNPDLVHLHNWHFASGPIMIRTLKKMHIPIVVTLHNYRLVCPSGILFNKDEIFCESVKSSFPWIAIYNKAYRNSYSQTFWLAFINWFHRKIGTWKMVDQYIVLTQFAKNVFLSSTLGLSADKFTLNPNFIFPIKATKGERNGAIFVGRLTTEKGLEIVLQGFLLIDITLDIYGEGPLSGLVQEYCMKRKNISYLGVLDNKQVLKKMSAASVLIFPSLWYEGMPMTIIEAFSAGTPVIANNLGAMSTMITHGYNGLHYDGTVDGLAAALKNWNELTDRERNRFSENALKTYHNNYTPERNYEILIEIYKNAIESK